MRALILDYGGVLTLTSPTAMEDYERLAKISMREYRDALTRAADRLGYDPLAAVEDGTITEDAFLAAVEAEAPAAHIANLGWAYYSRHVANPPMIDCAREYHERGMTTVLINNAASEWTHYWAPKIPRIEEDYDHVVLSCEARSRKPDPGYFRYVLGLLDGIPAGECVVVDDDEACCAGAAEVGMHAIRFTDNDTALAALALASA